MQIKLQYYFSIGFAIQMVEFNCFQCIYPQTGKVYLFYSICITISANSLSLLFFVQFSLQIMLFECKLILEKCKFFQMLFCLSICMQIAKMNRNCTHQCHAVCMQIDLRLQVMSYPNK